MLAEGARVRVVEARRSRQSAAQAKIAAGGRNEGVGRYFRILGSSSQRCDSNAITVMSVCRVVDL